MLTVCHIYKNLEHLCNPNTVHMLTVCHILNIPITAVKPSFFTVCHIHTVKTHCRTTVQPKYFFYSLSYLQYICKYFFYSVAYLQKP